MDLGLPPRFVRLLNTLDAAFIEYQAEVNPVKRRNILPRIFLSSCELMNLLDLNKLKTDLSQIKADLDEVKKWHDDNFDEFLDLENRIFKEIGVKDEVRARVAEYLTSFRSNIAPTTPLPVDQIVNAVNDLKSEVCRLFQTTGANLKAKEEEASTKSKRIAWRQKVQNIAFGVTGAAIVVVNVASGVRGYTSADVASYSANGGFLLLSFRKWGS